jgi:hypothetical protein
MRKLMLGTAAGLAGLALIAYLWPRSVDAINTQIRAQLVELADEVEVAAPLAETATTEELRKLAARLRVLDTSTPGASAELSQTVELIQRALVTIPASSDATTRRHVAARTAQERLRILRQSLDTDGQIFQNTLGRTLSWIAAVVLLLLPWPLTIIIVLLIAVTALTTDALRGALNRVAGVKVGDVSLSFALDADAEKNTNRIAIQLAEIRRKTKEAYAVRLQQSDVRELLRVLVETHVQPKFPAVQLPHGFRCAIHVPDALFADSLYQLTDYWPSGGGSGRVWSIRYGLIGKVWRLDKPQVNDLNERDKLIKEGGMTSEEADSQTSKSVKKSYSCSVLHEVAGNRVALLYMDAVGEDSFKAIDDDVHQQIDRAALALKLTERIVTIGADMRRHVPFIKMYD